MQEHVGFIKIYRSMLDWEWYTDQNTKDVFLHILLNASWKETKIKGKTILAGEWETTTEEISKDLGLTISQVRTALKHLKTTNEVTIKTTPKSSIISIKNWGKFQESDKQNAKQTTNKRQTPFHYKEEDKEVKNIKKREGGFAAPTLDEVRSYISERRYTFSAERFHSYYSVQGWKRHGRYIENWKSLADYWQTGEKEKPEPEERNSSFDVEDLRSFGILSE